MLLLTVPIFFPLMAMNFDPVWFGIIVVVVTEISLITPPIGLNVFVLKGVLKDVSTATIFRGVTPFWITDIFRLALLAFLPGLTPLATQLHELTNDTPTVVIGFEIAKAVVSREAR